MIPFPAARMAALVVNLLVFCQLAGGGFRGFPLSAADVLGLLCLVPSVAASVRQRLRRVRNGETQVPWMEDLEVGMGLLCTAHVAVGLGGPSLFPVIYLLMAVLATFLSRSAVLAIVALALVFEALLHPDQLFEHGTFLMSFAALYQGVLTVRGGLSRKAETTAVKNRLKEVEAHARNFRLDQAQAHDSRLGLKDHETRLLASAQEMEGAASSALQIGAAALGTHTCAAFLCASDERMLQLYSCRSASERVLRTPFFAGEGILGGVLKRIVPIRMVAPSGLKGITYYEPDGPLVKSVLVVPIVESQGTVRGVLVADRLSDEAFTERDENLMNALALELLRSMEVERVMMSTRQSRDEKERFFKAIEELNRSTSMDQVFDATLESTRQLAGLDLCALTIVREVESPNADGLENQIQRKHRIVRLAGWGAGGTPWEGREFADNHGLVSNVVRYGAPLPGRELAAMDRSLIFDAELPVKGISALKIFPLLAGGQVLGTLVAGSRKPGPLEDDVLRIIEVMALQAAQALLRAQLFEQMEKMATTDGLTGLLNHRTFQAKAGDVLVQAKRYGRKCSLLLTDIDHFKSVNDTYGHPVGDLVLKGVAKVLQRTARDADIVARYGGEEFAVVMPETDLKGARIIAERIREAVAAELFSTDQGNLKVTLSIGIATSPDHADQKQGLIDLADQCLYQAKRMGRNRSVTVAELKAAELKAAARVA